MNKDRAIVIVQNTLQTLYGCGSITEQVKLSLAGDLEQLLSSLADEGGPLPLPPQGPQPGSCWWCKGTLVYRSTAPPPNGVDQLICQCTNEQLASELVVQLNHRNPETAERLKRILLAEYGYWRDSEWPEADPDIMHFCIGATGALANVLAALWTGQTPEAYERTVKLRKDAK